MPIFNGYCLKEESLSFNPPPLLQEGGKTFLNEFHAWWQWDWEFGINSNKSIKSLFDLLCSKIRFNCLYLFAFYKIFWQS